MGPTRLAGILDAIRIDNLRLSKALTSVYRPWLLTYVRWKSLVSRPCWRRAMWPRQYMEKLPDQREAPHIQIKIGEVHSAPYELI
jgi:hypothetical protein